MGNLFEIEISIALMFKSVDKKSFKQKSQTRFAYLLLFEYPLDAGDGTQKTIKLIDGYQ